MPAYREYTSEASAFSSWLTTYAANRYAQYDAAVMQDEDGAYVIVSGSWVTRYQAEDYELVSLHTCIQDAANESMRLQIERSEKERPTPSLKQAVRQWVYWKDKR